MINKSAALITISVLVLGVSVDARANLVLNGGFEAYTPGVTGPRPNGDLQYSPVTGWTSPPLGSAGTTTGNLLYLPGTGDDEGSFYFNTGFGGPGGAIFKFWGPDTSVSNGLPDTSPAGGNYIGLDSDPDFNGALSQTINGLTPGQNYFVSFWWAAAQLSFTTGDTFNNLEVTFGSAPTQTLGPLNNPSQGFQDWRHQTLTFTADSVSQNLSFLAVGGPGGLPPFVLLDGVSVAAVPEPSTLVLGGIGVGLFGIGAVRRLRRRAAA